MPVAAPAAIAVPARQARVGNSAQPPARRQRRGASMTATNAAASPPCSKTSVTIAPTAVELHRRAQRADRDVALEAEPADAREHDRDDDERGGDGDLCHAASSIRAPATRSACASSWVTIRIPSPRPASARDELLDRRGRHGVQRGRRLVEQQRDRIARQRPRHRHPRRLAAGQLQRGAVHERRVEPSGGERVARAPRPRAPRARRRGSPARRPRASPAPASRARPAAAAHTARARARRSRRPARGRPPARPAAPGAQQARLADPDGPTSARPPPRLPRGRIRAARPPPRATPALRLDPRRGHVDIVKATMTFATLHEALPTLALAGMLIGGSALTVALPPGYPRRSSPGRVHPARIVIASVSCSPASRDCSPEGSSCSLPGGGQVPRGPRLPVLSRAGEGNRTPISGLGSQRLSHWTTPAGCRESIRPAITLQDVRPRLYWPITLAAAALVALLTYGVAAVGPDTSLDQSLREGKRVEAPVKDLPKLGADGTGSLADQKGKVVVLNVWASWCGPCQSRDAAAPAHARARSPRRAASCSASTRRSRPRRRSSSSTRRRSRSRACATATASTARKFGVTGYPETFLIDRTGKIAALTARAGRPGVARPSTCRGCSRSRREGPARARAGPRADRAPPSRRTTLPDIEDEVMCVECKTALNVSTSPVADQERAFIREKIAQGLTKRRSRPRWWTPTGPTCSASPRPRASTSASWLVPGALVAGGRGGGVLLLARRWRRTAAEPAAARRPGPRPRRRPAARRRAGELRPVNDGVDTTVIAAFAVGFVSFISPCVLPLVPGYLSAVSGVSLAEIQHGEKRLSRVLLPAIVFCLSFTVVFVALGMTATGLGSTLQRRPRHARQGRRRGDHRARRAVPRSRRSCPSSTASGGPTR